MSEEAILLEESRRSLEGKVRKYMEACGYDKDIPCSVRSDSGSMKIFIGDVHVPIASTSPLSPAHAIPESMMAEYTMNGEIPVLYFYFENISQSFVVYNNAQSYETVFKLLDKRAFSYYEKEVNSFYDAFDKYSVENKSVLVWGLVGCNCEAMALWKNASEVIVVDYNKPICEHERIRVLDHEELEKSDVKTDVSISYSSFEHDGLGRYGDPLDPNGDLRAMQEAKRFLKDDGIMFFGAPVARDCLLWNANRIYGEKRLPLLLKGWACIDAFNSYGRMSPGFPFDLPLGASPQPLLVLKKIETDFPDDAWLDERIQQIAAEIAVEEGSQTTRDPHLLLNILGMVKAYKRRSQI